MPKPVRFLLIALAALLLLPFLVQGIGEARAWLHRPAPAVLPERGEGWRNPYAKLAPPSKWLLANFHVHSSRWEGELSPEELVKTYRDKGYDVLAISDHQLITHPKLAPPGMLLLSSYEHGANIAKVHFGVLEPHSYYWDWLPLRQTPRALRWISDTLSDSARFLVLNHPSCAYPAPMKIDDIAGMPAVGAIELISHWACGDPAFGNLGIWDELWRRGKRIWATGGDDSHHRSTIGAGATFVFAEPTRDGVIAALHEGAMVAVGTPLGGPRALPVSVTLGNGAWRLVLDTDVDEITAVSGKGPIVKAARAREIFVPESQLAGETFLRFEYKSGSAHYYLNPVSRY